MKRKKGFTLVEILVVISIIAVLISIALVSYTTVNKQSRDARRKSDLEQLRSALEIYKSDNGSYPGVDSGSFGQASDLSTYIVPGYIAAVPSDPKSSQNYWYTATSLVSGKNYGYCVCALLEVVPQVAGSCSISLPNSCNYVLKNP